MARQKPRYPTREELAAGAPPVEAVPSSRLLKLLTGGLGHRLDLWLVRWTGFSLISWQAARDRGIPYQPSLLLTTTGRKSGLQRTVVLPYVRDGEDYVVVGSNAGGSKTPAWVENLRAGPNCSIVVHRRRRDARGSIPEGEARERLFPVIAARRPHIYNYEYHAARNGRRLELVVLSPCP